MFRETELLGCFYVTSQQKAKNQSILLLLKKTLLVGLNENFNFFLPCSKTIPQMIPRLLERHCAQMAFKTGVTMCAVICGNKVRQDYRQVYCLPPPVHRLVILQGLEKKKLTSVDTEAKPYKIKKRPSCFFCHRFCFYLKKM